MKEAIEIFNSKAKDKKDDTAYYGVIRDNGSYDDKHCVNYCHAGIQSWFGKSDISHFIISVQNPYKKIPVSLRDKHIKWMVENSVWSQFIDNPSGEDAVENGILFNNKCPKTLLKAGCITSRMTTENHTSYGDISYQSFLWEKFCDLGMDPSLAYVFTYMFYYNEKNSWVTPKIWDSWHLSMSPIYFGRDYIHNFVTGNYDDTSSVPIYGGLKSCDELWGENRTEENWKFVSSLVPSSLSNVSLNPFKKIQKEVRVFKEEYLPSLVKQLEDYYYSFNMKRAA